SFTGEFFCDFFFPSRRRHTRSDRDWSSDVCSSDLEVGNRAVRVEVLGDALTDGPIPDLTLAENIDRTVSPYAARHERAGQLSVQIGRAACRERGESAGGA